MMTLAKRITDARIKAGLNQTQLAKKVGIKPQAIQRIEEGLTKNPRQLSKIAEALSVSEVWIKYGYEPSAYTVARENRKEENKRETPEIIKKVPIVKLEDFSNDRDLSDTIITQIISNREKKGEVLTMYFKASDIVGNKIAAVKAESLDSMIPDYPHEYTIYENDWLIVDFDRSPKIGEIVLAQTKNGLTFRQYIKNGEELLLKALNKQYPIITDFKVIGVVINRLSPWSKQ